MSTMVVAHVFNTTNVDLILCTLQSVKKRGSDAYIVPLVTALLKIFETSPSPQAPVPGPLPLSVER